MHYSFNTVGILIIPVNHGNAQKEDAQVFRSTQHSVKIECREAVEKSQKAAIAAPTTASATVAATALPATAAASTTA